MQEVREKEKDTAVENATLDTLSPIGGGKHLRMRLLHMGQSYDAVFFSQTLRELGATVGQKVDLIFSPQINEFRSRRSVQLVITDLRLHGRRSAT